MDLSKKLNFHIWLSVGKVSASKNCKSIIYQHIKILSVGKSVG